MSHDLRDWLDGPALQPPPGQVPNFQDPWNLNSIGHFTNVICLLSTTFVVVLRLLAKVSSGKKFEIEDGMPTILFPSYGILITDGLVR